MLNFANDSSKHLGIKCPFSLKIVVNPHAAASQTIGWDRGGTGRQICDGSGLCFQEGRQRGHHIILKSSTELGTQWALSDHTLMVEWNVSSLLLRYFPRVLGCASISTTQTTRTSPTHLPRHPLRS